MLIRSEEIVLPVNKKIALWSNRCINLSAPRIFYLVDEDQHSNTSAVTSMLHHHFDYHGYVHVDNMQWTKPKQNSDDIVNMQDVMLQKWDVF